MATDQTHGLANRESPTQLYPLHAVAPSRAAELSGRGRPYSPVTVCRWAAPGIEGVRLRVVETPDAKLTCDQWILDFWEELARVREAKASPKGKPKSARRPRGLAAQRRARRGGAA